MTKLNQIIAVANGKKTEAEKAKTVAYQKVQKVELLTGINRKYQPNNDDGDKFPEESKAVQYTVLQALEDFKLALGDMFNVIATQEYGNCDARADIVVDGNMILEKVPVTYLLFLEKQLVDLHTMIDKLPVLDPATSWNEKSVDKLSAGVSASMPTLTVKTKKIQRFIVVVPPTEQHPAQVKEQVEDINVGIWTTTAYSGAIMETKKKALKVRLANLQAAVKMAREEANSIEVKQIKVADPVFGYLFQD